MKKERGRIMSKKLISLADCCVAFDGELVLDHINLYFNDSEFLTLLGPSGCGKTTTLRIIGGFLTPTSGEVLFDGARINDIPPNLRQVNTVFQRYALFPHLNVFENVATDRENKHVTPSVDADGEKQYTDPALKVKKIGDLVLQLPPNTVQGTPIQVVFRASGIGLEVSATNLETNESATVTIESDDGGILLPDELDERKKRFADIKTSGQI